MSNVFECTTAVVSETRGGVLTRDHHSSVPTTHDDFAAHLAAFRVRAEGGGRGKVGEREGGREGRRESEGGRGEGSILFS